MTKSKSQLRAEAVERLKDYEGWRRRVETDELDPDLLMAVIGVEAWDATWQGNRDSLIDLLADDEPETITRDGIEEIMRNMAAEVTNGGVEIHGAIPIEDALKSAMHRVDDLLVDEEPQDERDSREKLEAADRMLSLLTGKERMFIDGESYDKKQNTREKRGKSTNEDYVFVTGTSFGPTQDVEWESTSTDNELESIRYVEKDKIDTREKLEEDVVEFCNRFYTTERRYSELIALLDRQAAITRAECEDELVVVDWWTDEHGDTHAIAANGDEVCHYVKGEHAEAVNKMIAELEVENAELKSRHCPHYHVKEHYCDVHETRIAELLAKVDALEAERDEYKRLWEMQTNETACQSADLVDEQKKCTELQEQVDTLEAEREHWQFDTASWKANYRHMMKQRDELLAKVDVLEEENRLMRERLRSIADNDVTVFGMKLDEVRNLQAENAELRAKLDAIREAAK